MKFVILLPGKSLNDATQHYVYIISQAIKTSGFAVRTVATSNLISSGEIIVIINVEDYLKTLKFLTNRKFICWYQGIGEEELIMENEKPTFQQKKVLKKIYFSEKFDLNFANLNIFVSEAMQNYFYKKHNIKRKNRSFIMPCYNKSIYLPSFNEEKYKEPTFVYAGSINKWQCVEKTLEIYSLVEKRLKNAKLTLLAKESKELHEMILKYNIQNYEIKYVKLEELDFELGKHKYGFLLREPHIVNKVSTPTKMNSYLANGLICIYTNVVDSFEKHINLNDYTIKFDNLENAQNCADKIIAYQEKDIKCTELLQTYKGLFEDYYSDTKYISELSNKITEIYGNAG